MMTIKISYKTWEELKKEFNSRKDFKNKLVAYSYYILISKQQLYKNFPYSVFTCSEGHLNINAVQNYCKELALSDRIHLGFAIANGETNDGIKLADFVAQAMRKNNLKRLKKIKNTCLIKFKLDERLIKKLF